MTHSRRTVLTAGVAAAAVAGVGTPVLIRLSQTHTRCTGSYFTGVKFGVGRRSDVARDPKQGAKRVEGVKATIKSERELVEVRL